MIDDGSCEGDDAFMYWFESGVEYNTRVFLALVWTLEFKVGVRKLVSKS